MAGVCWGWRSETREDGTGANVHVRLWPKCAFFGFTHTHTYSQSGGVVRKLLPKKLKDPESDRHSGCAVDVL